MSKLDTTKTKWDLTPLLAGDDDPKIQKFREVSNKAIRSFAKKWRDRTDYLTNAKVLRQALDELEAIYRSPEGASEHYYFFLRSSTDSDNPKIKAGMAKANEFYKEQANQLQFFDLALGAIAEPVQKQFLGDPELKPYREYLRTLFISAKHYLSEAEEKVLLMKSGVSNSNWQQMTRRLLSKEEREVTLEDGSRKMVGSEELRSLLTSPNKQVRDEAADAWNDILAGLVDVGESEINSLLEDKKINDELRGYSRPDESRHHSDVIDSEVVDALIEAVTETNELNHRYYKLKAQLLGQDKLGYHERSVSIGEVEMEYQYKDAAQLVYDTFADLEPEFAQIFKNFQNNGQIDVYPAKGKRGGAFCAYNGIGQPVYVMLNHTNKLRDVTTLAHELGHGINDEFMRRKQHALNFATPISTAEVASNFMEGFVFDRLLAKADEETRLTLLVDDLHDSFASIHRQIGIYRFEQVIHQEFRKQGYLDKEEIGKLFTETSAAYMGPAVEQSPGSQNWWLFIPHVRFFFYVYSYASGLLIAKALQAKVKADKSFVIKVKDFLSAGRSKAPKEIFADMGIDITDKQFWRQGLQELEAQLDETEKLAKKLGKI